MKAIIKTTDQIAKIRHAGSLLTTLHHELYAMILPGVSLMDLENYAQRFLEMNNATGTFKGYHGFPANLCLSLNDCLVHGIPDQTILQPGDLLKVDVGVTYQGHVADAAFSIVVGGDETDPKAASLIIATKQGLDDSLIFLQPGKTLHDFGTSVEKILKSHNFRVIRDLTGHGVGLSLHESPHIHNYGHKSLHKTTLQSGMIFALEPITAYTSTRYRESKPGVPDNGRNLYTTDGDKGCQREYTVLITDKGPEILAGMQTR